MKNIVIISCSIVYQDARVKSYIKSLVDSGYNVDLVSLKENEGDAYRAEEEGYLNYRVAKRYIGNSFASYIFYYFFFFLRTFLVVTRLSLKKKIDVVHYNNLPNFPIFAALLPKLRGAKIVLDNHDLITVMFASKFKGKRTASMLSRVLSFEQRISMAFADAIITADHNQKDQLVKEGAPSEKISVLLNVANSNWFKPKTEKRKRNDGEFRLIYHGTIAERLGLDVAIRAVALVKDQIPGIRFHLIGKGDFLDNCLNLIDELNANEVVLPSKCFYPVEKLSGIINTMDAGLVPNRKTRATDEYMLPVKLLEYVYMKLPVIAPRLRIIERYFDQSMLMYFNPGDFEDLAGAIIRLYHERDLRQSLVTHSQDFVEKHNWKAQEREYLRLIEH